MNRVLIEARKKGILVIHSPSDCMDFYKNTPQRRRAEDAPLVKTDVKFQWNYFNPEHEGHLEPRLEKAGCSCDTPQPCGPDERAWTRQNPAIEIGEPDAISDQGQEVYNLLEQRDIENVIIMGVHTNRCVLGRPFGIRQMVYAGKNVVLCRDLTDSYHRDPGRHFEGLELIIQHVEKYWCPTITSEAITGEPSFRFKGQ
jgi:nicotinamidase-related amidase